jgi:hypothetical protein
MKKILAIGLLALGAFALSQQQASAWCNSRFNIGMSWEHSSGGNNALWGAWRNGQPPGPEAWGNGGYGYGYGYPGGQHYHSSAPQSSMPYAYETPVAPSYAQPMPMQQPYQFATYPRPVYYYPR